MLLKNLISNGCDSIVGDCVVLAFQLFSFHARNGLGDGIDGIPSPGRALTTVDSESWNLNVRQPLRDASVACKGEVIRQGVGNAEECGPLRHCFDSFVEVRACKADEQFYGAFPVSVVKCRLDPVLKFSQGSSGTFPVRYGGS